MDHAQLERYSRHLLLPEIDFAGQQRLMDASVLVIGAGGLGSPAAMYLAASGVGRLALADHDHVDLGNLQRQILHGTADVGRPKTESGRDRLLAINPEVRVETVTTRLGHEAMEREAAGADVVLDASDNFETRFALSRACIAARKPLVWGAAIRLQGQLTVFDHRRNDSPCLTCLYPDLDEIDTAGCAASGVLAPLTGVIGSMMAVATLKILVDLGDTLCGRLLRFDAVRMGWQESLLTKDPRCTSCAR